VNRIVIALFVLSSTALSCDYFNDRPVPFVGNLYIWSPDGGNRKSLDLKIGEGSYSVIDIGGTVLIALGNNSLIYIKADSEEDQAYHLIKHERGEKIISNKVIDSVDFIKFEKSNNFKYKYYSK
jgi:hypothetical protein